MAAPNGARLVAGGQFFLRKLPQCGEHPVARLPAVALDLQHRFVDQSCRDVQHSELVFAIQRHLGRCAQRKASCECRQPPQQLLLVGVEMVMAPFDRRTHGLVSRQRAIAAAEQAKAIVQMVADCIERQNLHTRRGDSMASGMPSNCRRMSAIVAIACASGMKSGTARARVR
jgi:hypothetical protein